MTKNKMQKNTDVFTRPSSKSLLFSEQLILKGRKQWAEVLSSLCIIKLQILNSTIVTDIEEVCKLLKL